MEEYKEERLIQDRTMLTTFFKNQARIYDKDEKTLLTGFDNLLKLIRDTTGKLI